MKLFAVVDRRAKDVVTVFASVSAETAERSFLMLLTGAKSIYTDFPEDFDLYPVCDLSVKNGLIVADQNSSTLHDHGFTVNSFTVGDPIKYGSDYDKRVLSAIHADRFPVAAASKESEVKSDGNKD